VVKVLIVARTHMNGGICVGGLTLDTHKNIRLKPPGRANHTEDTAFEIGQIWELDFYEVAAAKPPHIEDVIVTGQRLVEQVPNMREFLLQRIHPWQGGPEQLFDRCLCLKGTGGYISASGSIARCSTGYWLPDRTLSLNKPLIPDTQNNKLYYETLRIAENKRPTILSIKYVGFAAPINKIPPGMLVRVSLARWWRPTETSEERCYLQLSGWYL
jgi:putative nucleic acid modification protein with dual OB domain